MEMVSDRRVLAELLRVLSFGGVIGEAEGETGLCRNHCRDCKPNAGCRSVGWALQGYQL
jgi:hypothetical protein